MPRDYNSMLLCIVRGRPLVAKVMQEQRRKSGDVVKRASSVGGVGQTCPVTLSDYSPHSHLHA